MFTYSTMLAVIILVPSFILMIYHFGYIFIMMRKLKSSEPIEDEEYATALAKHLNNPSQAISFALVATFWASWIPFISVRLYDLYQGGNLYIPMLEFSIVWLGILNSFWKAVILTSMSPQFRLALKVMCSRFYLNIFCKTKGIMEFEPATITQEA